MSESPLNLREKFIKVLFALAAVTIAASVVAVGMHQRATERKFEPHLAFPFLDARLGEVAKIKVTSRDGTLTLKRRSATDWVIAEKKDYPADVTAVRRLLLGLADLELVEAKTSREDWYKHLGLGDPAKGGDGIRFETFDADGERMTDLVSGMEQGLPDMNGATFRYVRLGENPQTYLSRGQLDLGATIDVWANLDFFDLDRSRFESVISKPGKGAEDSRSFTASRASPEDYNFTLQGVPAGFEPNAPGIANGVGSALSSMSIVDLAPASDIDFTGATELVYRTFDDLEIDVAITQMDNAYWIRFSAKDAKPAPTDTQVPADEAAPQDDAARQQLIETLNSRGKDWAFKVPDWKGDQMVMTMKSMIQAKGME